MGAKRPETVLRSSLQPTGPDKPQQNAAAAGGSSAAPSVRQRKRPVEREAGWRPKESVLQIAAATGRFETFGRAVTTAGLTNRLSAQGPLTVFAPTDKAFSKLPAAELNALLDDPKRLAKLLCQHVVPAAVRAPRRNAPAHVRTMDGNELEITVVSEDGGYAINGARLVKTNMRASNGTVHAIDTVLIAG